ncbi:MAG: hypothetical protein E7643_09325 [Ruminococcaceae bacterium]|nr:hypothetical protein [Oscillospiraceae bacterium]
MKKNAVGRVLMHKESGGKRVSSLHIPARLFCLLLALLIWLAIVNLNALSDEGEHPSEPEAAQETVV